MPRLSGRIAIVTGANSGIGRAIALAYAGEGASVICSDLNENSGPTSTEEPTHAKILKDGGKAAFVKADVTIEAEVEALVAAAVAQFGRLDM
jgi:NAD(P)-dependent dehydrogenase (short-subunit alcohol dehydrogenase family)